MKMISLDDIIDFCEANIPYHYGRDSAAVAVLRSVINFCKDYAIEAEGQEKAIEIDKVKNVFIKAIKAGNEMACDTQYDIGFQRGVEHGYYLFRMAAGEIKEE